MPPNFTRALRKGAVSSYYFLFWSPNQIFIFLFQFLLLHRQQLQVSLGVRQDGIFWMTGALHCVGMVKGTQLDWRDAESACQAAAIEIGGSDGHLAEIPYDGINCK